MACLPTGPSQGMSDTLKAVEAAWMASTVGSRSAIPLSSLRVSYMCKWLWCGPNACWHGLGYLHIERCFLVEQRSQGSVHYAAEQNLVLTLVGFAWSTEGSWHG